MRKQDIEVGRTYRNRYRGLTKRTVLEISHELKMPIFSRSAGPGDPVVRYRQDEEERLLSLAAFAEWCGCEVLTE